MAFGAGVGFRVDLTDPAYTPAEACFAESTSRVIVAVEREVVASLLARAATAGVPASVIGEAGGDRLIASGAFDVALADAERAWRDALPALMGH